MDDASPVSKNEHMKMCGKCHENYNWLISKECYHCIDVKTGLLLYAVEIIKGHNDFNGDTIIGSKIFLEKVEEVLGE